MFRPSFSQAGQPLPVILFIFLILIFFLDIQLFKNAFCFSGPVTNLLIVNLIISKFLLQLFLKYTTYYYNILLPYPKFLKICCHHQIQNDLIFVHFYFLQFKHFMCL